MHHGMNWQIELTTIEILRIICGNIETIRTLHLPTLKYINFLCIYL